MKVEGWQFTLRILWICVWVTGCWYSALYNTPERLFYIPSIWWGTVAIRLTWKLWKELEW
jgi:hypothetical protein